MQNFIQDKISTCVTVHIYESTTGKLFWNNRTWGVTTDQEKQCEIIVTRSITIWTYINLSWNVRPIQALYTLLWPHLSHQQGSSVTFQSFFEKCVDCFRPPSWKSCLVTICVYTRTGTVCTVHVQVLYSTRTGTVQYSRSVHVWQVVDYREIGKFLVEMWVMILMNYIYIFGQNLFPISCTWSSEFRHRYGG